MENKNPFKVPENYFKNFNNDIIKKIENLEQQKPKQKRSLYSSLKWISAAAVALCIITIGYNLEHNKTENLLSNVQEQKTTSQSISDNVIDINSDKQLASLQNDYYLFLEDEATQQMYNDYIEYSNLRN